MKRASAGAASIYYPGDMNQQATRIRARQHGRWWYHVQILIAALLVVVMSLLLNVVDHDRIAFAGFAQFPLPHTCASRVLWDAPCPACGLTRSFVLLFHGDIVGSLRMNLVGIWIAALVVFQIPYRLLALKSEQRTLLPVQLGPVLTYATLIALCVAWICRRFAG